MSSTDPSQVPPDAASRLKVSFEGKPLSSHGAEWDNMWNSSFTPWDRGGPSIALGDLLVDRRGDLFAEQAGSTGSGGRRKRALVPGCGRGYDALLLAAHGYEVCGLDYSAAATREAMETEKRAASGEMDEAYGLGGTTQGDKGTVTWATGDFYADDFLEKAGTKDFDLIFDYTFFCAMPPEARPKWAKRMSQLLAPDGGRLVCLEWPLNKDPPLGGPPWGLAPELYTAHLSRPGEEIRYGEDGRVAEQETAKPAAADGLRRLDRIQPRRTHKAGYDSEGKTLDFISVWSH